MAWRSVIGSLADLIPCPDLCYRRDCAGEGWGSIAFGPDYWECELGDTCEDAMEDGADLLYASGWECRTAGAGCVGCPSYLKTCQPREVV